MSTTRRGFLGVLAAVLPAGALAVNVGAEPAKDAGEPESGGAWCYGADGTTHEWTAERLSPLDAIVHCSCGWHAKALRETKRDSLRSVLALAENHGHDVAKRRPRLGGVLTADGFLPEQGPRLPTSWGIR